MYPFVADLLGRGSREANRGAVAMRCHGAGREYSGYEEKRYCVTSGRATVARERREDWSDFTRRNPCLLVRAPRLMRRNI